LTPELRVKNFDYSNETAKMIDEEILHLLDHSFAHALRIIRSHETFIQVCVQRLIEKEILEEQEIKTLWKQYRDEPLSGIVTNAPLISPLPSSATG
jgi:ATP-dependent Zn protease